MIKGFTLIELMIVVVVIGILTAIAIPSYKTMKETSVQKEAVATLDLIAAAERAYRSETEHWYPGVGTNITDINQINSNLKLALIRTNWIYWVWFDPGTNTLWTEAQRITTDAVKCTYKLNCSSGNVPFDRWGSSCY